MNDWVVETPTFEEDLMNDRVVMLNQNGVNRVVEIIKGKDKEIEKLSNIINELEKMMKNDLERACSMNGNGLFNGAIDILEVYLDKLHELKGDGSNE